MSLPDGLLTEFCSTFAGYGNPKASRWYVGMEEGGGNSEAEIVARLSAWEHRGKRQIEDLREFCRETGFDTLVRWATVDAPKQRTWIGLIEDKVRRENTSWPMSEMLHFQRTEWLSKGSNTCLLNLMPLPSPGTNDADWKYAAWTNLPQFRTRSLYLQSLVAERIQMLRKLIAEHRPTQLIFVGKTYTDYWSEVAEGFPRIEFVVIQHPAARSRGIASDNGIAKKRHAELVQRNLNWQSRLDSAVEHLEVRASPHYFRIENVSECEIYLGFIGGYGPNKLSIEWKIPKSSANSRILGRMTDGPPHYSAIPRIINAVGDVVQQRVQWQPNGKGNSGNVSILSLLHADRSIANETHRSWARRIYPLFREAISAI